MKLLLFLLLALPIHAASVTGPAGYANPPGGNRGGLLITPQSGTTFNFGSHVGAVAAVIILNGVTYSYYNKLPTATSTFKSDAKANK